MVLITVWNDYICPWAYASRSQTDWLRRQVAGRDIEIEVHGFELHPGIPAEGRAVRPGGRLDQVLDHIAAQCHERDLPFAKPTRTPNSRRALALSELVHAHHHDAFLAFDDGMARAHWVEGRSIDDDQVLAAILDEAGIDVDLIHRIDGEGGALLDTARERAMNAGATATPSWQINDLVVTGLHDDAQFHRWVGRILERSG